jgi:hypothetical protein
MEIEQLVDLAPSLSPTAAIDNEAEVRLRTFPKA